MNLSPRNNRQIVRPFISVPSETFPPPLRVPFRTVSQRLATLRTVRASDIIKIFDRARHAEGEANSRRSERRRTERNYTRQEATAKKERRGRTYDGEIGSWALFPWRPDVLRHAEWAESARRLVCPCVIRVYGAIGRVERTIAILQHRGIDLGFWKISQSCMVSLIRFWGEGWKLTSGASDSRNFRLSNNCRVCWDRIPGEIFRWYSGKFDA